MHRHHRGLAHTEDKQKQQNGGRRTGDIARENAAGPEIQGSRRGVGPDQRRQEKADGGYQQNEQVGPRPPPGRLGPLVGDQRIGGKGQHFIEYEQREQVGRKGNPHGTEQGNGETGVEQGLALLAVAAHVADGIDGGDDP